MCLMVRKRLKLRSWSAVGGRVVSSFVNQLRRIHYNRFRALVGWELAQSKISEYE
jgi:hypothetical protein